jgi:dephospho-CoA kinase
MNKIIAIVGMCGAGKSLLADTLVEQGWGFVRFGQITLDIVKERGLPLNEESENTVRREVRVQHGMGAYATLNIPKFDKVLEEKNLVADGLYSWSEYKILKEYYGDRLMVVAVYAPTWLRYERLSKRVSGPEDTDLRNRSFTKEDARKRDYNEIENVEKGGPIAMADYTILNIGTLDDYKKDIEKFITHYANKN